MATKDFAPIENDYAFFMAHATEAESDAAEYARQLAGFADTRPTIRMLDFGCGTGDFTQRLLSSLGWPASRLEIALAEPVEHQRRLAARRLAPFSQRAIAEVLPADGPRPFDLILSNHALYYVEQLDHTLQRLCGWLAPRGLLLVAIAGCDNWLIELWQIGFALLNRPVPYYTAEDVEAYLLQRQISFRKSPAPYQLRFADTLENRLKILRFLFGNHLDAITPARLLGQFDHHARAGHVEINTRSHHFAIPARD